MSIRIEYLNICRICLCEDQLTDILQLGETTIQWIDDIYSYYNVQLLFNDHKSTKLCINCIQKINMWKMDTCQASDCQHVINFLDAHKQMASEQRKT